MKFLRLDVQAFRGFREPFSIPLSDQGTVLVEGENRDGGGAMNSNGAGKTLAIVETLLWCLYGRMARYGSRQVTDEAIDPQRGAMVGVTVETRGVPYTATRSRGVKGSPTFGLSAPQGPVPISRDFSKRTMDVAALLGFDYNAFRYAVVVQGGESLAHAGFATQMAVLESILHMDELSTAADLARQQANQRDRELVSLRTEVRMLEQALDQSKQTLQRVKSSASIDYDDEIARLETDLKNAGDWAKLLPGLRDTAASAANHHDWVQREAGVKRGEWGAAKRDLDEAQRGITSVICPTCKRPLKGEEERQALLTRIQQLEQESDRRQRVYEEASQKIGPAAHKKQAVEVELRDAEDRANLVPRISDQIDQLQRQREEYQAQLQGAEQQVQEAESALAEALDRRDPLEASLQRAQFWTAGYGRDGLQAELFAAAVPVLNNAAARYGQLLTDGRIRVIFNPLRGKRTEDLVVIEGAEAPTYEGLSSGQKERVDLMIALSLRDLARWRLPEPVNLCVFDECFDSIDEAGLRVVARLLQEETHDGGSTFVVSHSAAMKALFPGARVLRVIRQGGEATVRYVS